MESIVLTQKDKDELITHAIEQQPNESCAMLLGTRIDGIWNVKEIFRTQNIDNSQTNFTISPEELLKGYQLAEKMHLELVGIFHSHPKSEPSPSNTDIKFMKGNPVPWIIYSGITKEMKAYFLAVNNNDLLSFTRKDLKEGLIVVMNVNQASTQNTN